jgi:FAD dependent oxidoreductase
MASKSSIGLILGLWVAAPAIAAPVAVPTTQSCDLLVVGAGLAAAAAAYEALLLGRTVCLTDVTDWVGGQISSQGTSAFDESQRQRALAFYPRGYLELRDRLEKHYGKANPGDCWVSLRCFLPKDGHGQLVDQLRGAERRGRGLLRWFPNTVVADLDREATLITGAIAIQHRAAVGSRALADRRLSEVVDEAYNPVDSAGLTKQRIRFGPRGKAWMVVDATETGELVGLADVPYRLGLDPRSLWNPSSASEPGDAYCTQGFTYTFAMEQTAAAQVQVKPEFYDRYAAYYGYDPKPTLSDFDVVFTYRRIWAPQTAGAPRPKVPRFGIGKPQPGDISMQNWVWGNDYRPGTAADNLIYSRDQLRATGQLSAGGWRGGLRRETLAAGEELALGFYHWLVAGTTNSQGAASLKKPAPNHRLLQGPDSPMGTGHGLSKFPYIREARRIIGRPGRLNLAQPEGFSITELDISGQSFEDPLYADRLGRDYRSLQTFLSGPDGVATARGAKAVKRGRATVYPDSVGISQYAIDVHPCMATSPAEAPGNIERPGTRQGQGHSYPAQVPLRALIPQQIDNLLIAGKAMAASQLAAAAYRTHSFEWSIGAAAGTTAVFSLDRQIWPYQLVDDFPQDEPQLRQLQRQLVDRGNPTQFPNTFYRNDRWQDWKVW